MTAPTSGTTARRLSVGVVHGMKAIRSRAASGHPMKAWDYYRANGMWDSFKPFVQEAHDDRLELLDRIEQAEAELAEARTLLDAAPWRPENEGCAHHHGNVTYECSCTVPVVAILAALNEQA